MHIKIDWMMDVGNNPRFIVEDVVLPEPAPIQAPVYERRGDIHRYDQGMFSHFFASDGKPTSGFGGATFAGTFKDGKGFEYRGAWSSRSSYVNKLWPEHLLVDVVCGHMAVHMSAQALIDWWHESPVDWGLAWVRHSDGELHLMPTKNGELKNKPFGNDTVIHITRRQQVKAP